MNREQKRALNKSIRKRGVPKDDAAAYVEIFANADAIRQNGTGEHTPAQEINEGDSVRINIDAVTSRQNYGRMSQNYKTFVDENKETVFTAHVEKTGSTTASRLISFKENPRWLFWSGDLIVINSEESNPV